MRCGVKAGVMQPRWTGSAEAPRLTVRLVKAKDLRASLPTGTAIVTREERNAILREQAIGAQSCKNALRNTCSTILG